MLNHTYQYQYLYQDIRGGMAQMQWLRKYDLYQKIPADLSEGTNAGGCISVIAISLIIYLIMQETSHFLNPPVMTRLRHDDPVTREEMKITLDISFPRFPCGLIALDLLDELYSHHPNIGSVQKRRIDKQGMFIDNISYESFSETDIQKQYLNVKNAILNNQGCRVMGQFTVKAVPGNFHLSSHGYQGLYLRTMVDMGVTLDISHHIHQLYFGTKQSIQYIENNVPTVNMRRLKGRQQIHPGDQLKQGLYHNYHVDVVPTVYQNPFIGSKKGYQYTFSHMATPTESMPGVYFNYHIGGIIIDIYSNRESFLQFTIQLCAIIGGAYCLCMLLSNAMSTILDSNKGYQLIQ